MLFVIFAIAAFGLIGWIKIEAFYLKTLFGSVLLEIAGAVILLYKKVDFFRESVERDLDKYRPNQEAKKVLATFWSYQIHSFGGDTSRRWGARLPADRHAIPRFYRGMAELIEVGVVEIDPSNNQGFLTMEGFGYCRRNNEWLLKEPRYEY